MSLSAQRVGICRTVAYSSRAAIGGNVAQAVGRKACTVRPMRCFDAPRRLRIAGVISAVVLGGCGGAGGAGGSHAAPGAPTARHASGPYRWLVRTTGAPPSIQSENALRGTTTWRLPGPIDQIGGLASGNVRGYASPETVSPGQTLRIAAEARGARHLRITIYRMGWYGGTGGRAVLVSA